MAKLSSVLSVDGCRSPSTSFRVAKHSLCDHAFVGCCPGLLRLNPCMHGTTVSQHDGPRQTCHACLTTSQFCKELLVFRLVELEPIISHVQTKVFEECRIVLVRTFHDGQGSITFVDVVQIDEPLDVLQPLLARRLVTMQRLVCSVVPPSVGGFWRQGN